MKYVRLIRLTLENFKGAGSFTLDAQGGSVTVAGTNGTGKTTLFDAYNWLLFGKDSAGRSDSSFDVKPYGTETPIVSVCGVFDLGEDGIITLKRQLAEKLVRQKGTDEESIRNDYSFFVDDVPKTKTQYDAVIEEICPAATLMMVSDPDWFAGKMKWQDRRRVLSELFGGMDESSLLSGKEWAELAAAAGGKAVADCQKIMTAERRRIRDELDALPARIDEAQAAVPDEVAEFDPDEVLAAERAVSSAERDMRAASDGTAAAALNRQIAEARAELAKAKAQYYSSFDNSAAQKEISRLGHEKMQIENKMSSFERKKLDTELSLDEKRSLLSELREQYRAINALVFDSKTEVCPCCHRRLPEEDIDRLRAEFNRDKAEKLEKNVSAGKNMKAAIDDLITEMAEYQSEIKKLLAVLDAKRAELEKAETRLVVSIPFESTQQYFDLSATIDSLEYQLASEKENAAGRAAEYAGALERAKERLAAVREKAAAQAFADRQAARVETLKRQGRELGRRAAELDRLLDMAARFEQYKLTAIEANVNGKFRYAKFKLFDQQLNGGYSECCEVVVDDAPYSTNLNPGKKINAGLDIIRTLSEAVGVSAPVWIDNCESYVRIDDIGAQLIRLRVDSSASVLTVEHAD